MAIGMEETAPQARTGRVRYVFRLSILFLRYLFDHTAGFFVDSAQVITREKELFFGTGLFLLGLLNFNTGKYCDGNSADYLSCTRPAVYYYFDALDIALVILGVFLVLAWLVQRNRQR